MTAVTPIRTQHHDTQEEGNPRKLPTESIVINRLVLLHVIPEQKAGALVSAADITTSSGQLLRKVVPPEAGAWCNAEYFVERGDPAEKILEFARQRETDLIVLGVRREKGVPGAAIHLPIATAHKIVSHAGCPVLTVRH